MQACKMCKKPHPARLQRGLMRKAPPSRPSPVSSPNSPARTCHQFSLEGGHLYTWHGQAPLLRLFGEVKPKENWQRRRRGAKRRRRRNSRSQSRKDPPLGPSAYNFQESPPPPSSYLFLYIFNNNHHNKKRGDNARQGMQHLGAARLFPISGRLESNSKDAGGLCLLQSRVFFSFSKG